jgi:NitT/TauT family transport system substrate-binding protein
MTACKRAVMRRLAGGLVALLALAAGGMAGAAPAWAAARAAHKLTTLNLSYVPYSNDSSLFLGIEKGFFAKRGIKLALSTAANPGVVIAGMESGQYQIGFSAIVEVIDARAHGTLVRCVSNVDGNQSADATTDGTTIVANPKAGVTKLADLKGKTVATVQTSSLNSLTADDLAQAAGVDPSTLHYVTMGFAEMPQALAQGSVQAAIITSPFSQEAVQEGMKVLAHPNVSVMANQSTVCFAATDSWLASHAKLAHAFQQAMAESIAYSKSHQAEAAATLVSHGLAKNLAQAESYKLGTNWNPKLYVSSIQKTEKLLERYGFIQASQAPKPSSVIYPGT